MIWPAVGEDARRERAEPNNPVRDSCARQGQPGVVTGDFADRDFASRLIEPLGWHRHWDRVPGAVSPRRKATRRQEVGAKAGCGPW